MNSPKDNYTKKLGNALESESIKPLYQDFVRANNFCNKITKHIFKPFIVISSLAVLYAGANAIGSVRNLDYMIKSEISSKVYYAKKDIYDKNLLVSGGVAAGSAFLTLGILGGALINSGRKEKKLEEALNREGLSLEDL